MYIHVIFFSSASSGTLSDPDYSGNASPMNGRPDGSIANHYSNDPHHKTWRDSLDKKTKKELMADYARQRRPSKASVDSFEEKKKFVVVVCFFVFLFCFSFY